MRRVSGWRWTLVVAAIVMPLVVTAPVDAADPAVGAPTAIAITAAAVHAGEQTQAIITLTTGSSDDGTSLPLAGASVLVEQQTDDGWIPVATVVTDASGSAAVAVTLGKDLAANTLRATFAGDTVDAPAQATATLALAQWPSLIAVTGPGKVVDEHHSTVTVTWTASDGEPVAGPVALQRQAPDGAWHTAKSLTTGVDGVAAFSALPRTDTRWRAVAAALPWVAGGTSAVYLLDNLPPSKPVVLPKGAPKPKITLPPQPHAVGAGANPVVTKIPDSVWHRMDGISWRPGCPVGRSALRLLTINYWDFSGYRRRGQLVAAANVMGNLSRAFSALYTHRFPIRAMYLVDRFGYSSRTHGANDYASMEADNTSAFNCRYVDGQPGAVSPHSYGDAVDINTWENPYRSRLGTVPNTWWQARSNPRVAWRSSSHPVVRLLARYGLIWVYENEDTQHFSIRRG